MSKWYSSGLKFQCTGCGQCCTGAPGYVWVTLDEMQEIAAHLDLSLNDLMRKYIRRVGHRYSLIELKKTFDCVFLKDKKCQVYAARPKQCRTFPWWQHNLSSSQAWQEAAKNCEGISEDAPVVDFAIIEEQLEETNKD